MPWFLTRRSVLAKTPAAVIAVAIAVFAGRAISAQDKYTASAEWARVF
jgi:hypothetical protein